jgi:predicted N-acetyltransferase YhbS
VIFDRYQRGDRDQVAALFRRVFGDVQADASARRWDWQYGKNPNAHEPRIWIARDGGTIVGQYATMPVTLWVAGRELDASWGMDVMVAPDRQRQGIGEALFQTWDTHTDASLGMGLSVGSHRLFQKLHWPDVGPVPCLVKPLSPRALVQPGWPPLLRRAVSVAAAPILPVFRSRRSPDPHIKRVDHFDDRFTELWRRVAPKFDLAVRRDAAYLEWKYVEPPHVKYSIAALARGEGIQGYVVYRHAEEARGRVTLLVDFLADPDDRPAFWALLQFVEHEAVEVGADKVRTFVMNAAFRRIMQMRGHVRVASSVQFVAKVNAVQVGPEFYADTSRWHITFGDSDQDR